VTDQVSHPYTSSYELHIFYIKELNCYYELCELTNIKLKSHCSLF